MHTSAFFSNKDYRSILDELYDGMYVVDRDRVIQYWNKAAEHITGYSAQEVIGKSCSQNILTHVDKQGCNLCKGKCPLLGTMETGEKQSQEVFLHHKEGHRVPVEVRVSTLHDDAGNIIGGVELFRASSGGRAAMEERMQQLQNLALTDALTGVGNRNLIEQELSARIHEYDTLQIPFGVLFLDVDHFKRVNDEHGHDMGDRILASLVAATLKANLRTFDLVGRWGGEEFICILRNVQDGALAHTAERMRMLVEQAYIIERQQKLQVTVSIGGTIVQPGDTTTSLCKRADQLMYQSKHAGRNRVTLG